MPPDADEHALLLSDEPALPASFARCPGGITFELLGSSEPERVIARCSDGSVAVVVADLPQAHPARFELVRAITTRTAVPVVVLSDDGAESLVADAIAAGAMMFLLKPFSAHQLLPILRFAIRRGRELQALRVHADQLNHALRSNRNVSVAAGLLMARLAIGEQEALERMRHQARTRRIRLEDFASEVLAANDTSMRALSPLIQPESSGE